MESLETFVTLSERALSAIKTYVVGMEAEARLLFIAALTGGHVLIEGPSGTGKTYISKVFASVFGLDMSRIQFTSDLMPSDITGMNILNEDRMYQFERGPIFHNLILADHINRATPRTQSALLEAMEEDGTVSAGGNTHKLPSPFMIIATQNPLEAEGTYPLSEAALDRFTFRILVDHPDETKEHEIILNSVGKVPFIRPVVTGSQILQMAEVVAKVPVSHHISNYALRIVRATREQQDYIKAGAGVRASIALVEAAKAHCLLAGRYNTSFEDVAWVAPYILAHRVSLNFEGLAEGISAYNLVKDIMSKISPTDMKENPS